MNSKIRNIMEYMINNDQFVLILNIETAILILALSSVSDEFRMVLKLPLGLIRLKQRRAILVYTLDFPSPMTILIPFLVMSSHWTAWDLLHLATCCWRLENIWRSGLLYQGQCTFCTSDTEDRAIASIAHPYLYIII